MYPVQYKEHLFYIINQVNKKFFYFYIVLSFLINKLVFIKNKEW